MPRLLEEYIATGKVLFEYRDLTFRREESTRAAEAAACALDQGQFWPYHELLFAHQRSPEEESFSSEQVREIAGEAGLDLERFSTCLEGGQYADEIAAMQEESLELGLDSTPSLLVNGVLVPYEEYEDLKAAVEAELDAAQEE